MNYCNFSTKLSILVIPTKDVESANTHILETLWDTIFTHLEVHDLRLFTEYTVKVLKEPLKGDEDTHRLMKGDQFIFNNSDFLSVVNDIYSIARVCKLFCYLTNRERQLLVDAAWWARIDRTFLMPEQKRPSPTKERPNHLSDLIDRLKSKQNAYEKSLHDDWTRRYALSESMNNLLTERLINHLKINHLLFEPPSLASNFQIERAPTISIASNFQIERAPTLSIASNFQIELPQTISIESLIIEEPKQQLKDSDDNEERED